MKFNNLLAFTITAALPSLMFAQGNTPCAATPLPVNSNCVNTSGTNAGATDSGIPNPGCAFYSGADVWYSVVVPPSGNVTVTTADNGGIGDGGLAMYSGACGSPTLLDCDDDGGAGLFSSISLVGQTPGATLLVRVWEYGGGAGGTFDICATDPIVPTNVTCNVPDPICSGSPIVFTAQSNGTEASVVNPGNDYDCLSTSPNPSWYYLEIATGGNLAIDITAGSDIDFAIWGPYPDVTTAIATCDAHAVPLDCSYSIAAVEQANVAGVVAGEVYVLLVTNYANTVQTITVDEAGSNTAATDCSIVPLPVEMVNFDAKSIDGQVQLQWRTLSERNNDFFIAERSMDGENWTGFALIDGAGNSNVVQNYSVTDNNPKGATAYYRLKQFDFDGGMTLSEVVSVSRNASAQASLYPNPAKESVQITSNDLLIQVDIVSVSGVLAKSISANNNTEVTINTTDITDGVYLARIHTRNETIVKRLVIRK